MIEDNNDFTCSVQEFEDFLVALKLSEIDNNLDNLLESFDLPEEVEDVLFDAHDLLMQAFDMVRKDNNRLVLAVKKFYDMDEPDVESEQEVSSEGVENNG